MTSTNKKRIKFLTALNKMLHAHKLDGVDYNWEYPANAKEWQNWYKLIFQSKKVLLPKKFSSDLADFARDSATSNDEYGDNIVTFTMYADPNHFKVVAQYKLLEVADFLHCMVYDMHQRHSTIQFAESSIALAVDSFRNAVDSRGQNLLGKWTLGVPFYGRDTINGEPMAYYDIAKKISPPQKRLTNCYHGGANVQYSRMLDDDHRDTLGRQYYNSQNTIRMKTHLAMESNIGGLMIWELGQDIQPFGRESLLYAIAGCDNDDDRFSGIVGGVQSEL
jgi:chitinase